MAMDSKQLKELIIETLLEVDEYLGKDNIMYSEASVYLLLGTAAHESLLGTFLRQKRGPAIGIFQMEPYTYKDIYERISTGLRGALRHVSCTSLRSDHNTMEYNLKYAIIMARYKYYLVPHPLPEATNLRALAQYWKKWYNTPLGKGTSARWLEDYHRYIK